KIHSFFESNQNDFQGKSLQNAAKGADKGGRKGDIAIHDCHRPKSGTDLDKLYLQAFFAKEAFACGNVKRRNRVAAARISDPNFLCLSIEASRKKSSGRQSSE